MVIHSDQGREFENGLMKSICSLLGCTKIGTAPYHPESDGMIECFNRTCLMMLSMFVNDRQDNWHELLPYVMHTCRTSVHRLLPISSHDGRRMLSTTVELRFHCRTSLTGNRTLHHLRSLLGCGTLWRLPRTMLENHYVEQRSAGNGCTMLG